MTNSTCRIRFLSVLVSLVVAAVDPLAAASYIVVDVGPLTGGTAVAHRINSRGAVVGYSGFPHHFQDHAFFWTPQTGIRDLGFLRGGYYSSAAAVNSSNQ